jgi:hypothetical protein
VVEGAIPTRDDGVYMQLASRPAIQVLKEVASQAATQALHPMQMVASYRSPTAALGTATCSFACNTSVPTVTATAAGTPALAIPLMSCRRVMDTFSPLSRLSDSPLSREWLSPFRNAHGRWRFGSRPLPGCCGIVATPPRQLRRQPRQWHLRARQLRL